MNEPAYRSFFETGKEPSIEEKQQTSLTALIDKCRDARGVVTNSVELSRILGLPRRKLDLEKVVDVTQLFRREGGTMDFWPLQSAALIEASAADGLFGMMGVGSGKTLVTLALPDAMASKRAVLLVPPQLKEKTLDEIDQIYSKHFNLPLDRITIVKYSELSSAKKATILEDINPDLIIGDEAHELRHKTSARTKRLNRFAKEHPECRFVFLSGVMTNRSIIDYAHLIELALRKNNPLPRGFQELKDWSGATDVRPKRPMMPGALSRFCVGKETVREGFRRRLVETPGVIATSKDALGTGLLVRRLDVPVPASVSEVLSKVRKTWCLGDEEINSPLEMWRILRQVACGFYYQWDWPNDEKDHDWLEARAAWNKEVRQRLKLSREGQDSPLLCANAAERYYQWVVAGRQGPYPKNAWESSAWADWRAEKHKKKPPTKTVWIDDFLVKDVIKRAEKKHGFGPTIIWYEHRALGERIVSESGFPHYGAGTNASPSTAPVIVCSMQSQGTGKNLHHYSYNLLSSLPPNGDVFEQVAGRTHRPRQQADQVVIDWYGHTEETKNSLAAVIEDAEYKLETMGQKQKVLYATKIWNS